MVAIFYRICKLTKQNKAAIWQVAIAFIVKFVVLQVLFGKVFGLVVFEPAFLAKSADLISLD